MVIIKVPSESQELPFPAKGMTDLEGHGDTEIFTPLSGSASQPLIILPLQIPVSLLSWE